MSTASANHHPLAARRKFVQALDLKRIERRVHLGEERTVTILLRGGEVLDEYFERRKGCRNLHNRHGAGPRRGGPALTCFCRKKGGKGRELGLERAVWAPISKSAGCEGGKDGTINRQRPRAFRGFSGAERVALASGEQSRRGHFHLYVRRKHVWQNEKAALTNEELQDSGYLRKVGKKRGGGEEISRKVSASTQDTRGYMHFP